MQFDPDTYFNQKVQEYYNQSSKEIIIRLENSRKKIQTLEDLREQNVNQRASLYKFPYKGEFLSDSHRYHVIEMFQETYGQYLNNPVGIFFDEVLPGIKQEDKKDFERFKGTNTKPKYDLEFIENTSTEDILSLLANYCVLMQLWYQLSYFLCDYYKEDEPGLKRILSNEYIDISPSYFKEEILNDFPDIRVELGRIFTSANTKLNGTRTGEPFILDIPIEKEDAYINILHKLLKEKQFIEVEREAFTTHFKNDTFEKIRWKKSKVQLAYLIFELRLRNENIHEVTINHFLDKDGNEFVNNFSSIRLQMKSKYIEIDKILQQLKTI